MTKILVIEDEELIRYNILDLLEAEGFDASGAENGMVGLQIAKDILPDLILCDVMMPYIDGYAVLMQLRADPMTATIPFIFLTARAESANLQQGMNLGADSYVIKPCSTSELLEAIALQLEK